MSGGPRLDTVARRLSDLGEQVRERELDSLLVGGLIHPGDSGTEEMANLRWLTGYTGTSGIGVIGPERPIFITDFRYAERVESEIGELFDIVSAKTRLVPAIAEQLSGRVGFDDERITVATFRKLEKAVEGVELVPAAGVVERLRRHKDSDEIDAIAAAVSLCDQVFGWISESGLAGRSERDISAAAQARMREAGAEPSFAPIVAAGERGSLPHSDPSEAIVQAGQLITFDMGVELNGYCSDCTRTYAVGEVGESEREVYEIVLAAQRATLDAIRPGMSCKDADAVSRNLITEAGYGEEYGHGVGHGVGIEVHEAPRVSSTSEDTLEVGDVISVEPGIYLRGRFGVRIEDLVTITDDGHRNFNDLPKELTVVD